MAFHHEEDYPVRHLIDPTATDVQIIDCLRQVLERYKSENTAPTAEVNPHLASLHPSELPRCFVAAGPRWISPMKEKIMVCHGGTWKEKKCGYAAIRGGLQDSSPRYVGVKKILEFHHRNGAKTGWKMIQYQVVRNLVVEEKITICKVFQQMKTDGKLGKHHHQQVPPHLGASSSSPGTTFLVPAPEYLPVTFFEAVDDLMNNFNADEHPIYDDMQIPGEDQFTRLRGERINEYEEVPQEKRRRSDVWEHFSRIHTNNPVDVYAACHMCDAMLKADGKKYGTSHLKRHYKVNCAHGH